MDAFESLALHFQSLGVEFVTGYKNLGMVRGDAPAPEVFRVIRLADDEDLLSFRCDFFFHLDGSFSHFGSHCTTYQPLRAEPS